MCLLARLVLTTADGLQLIELGAQNTIGRNPSSTIQIQDRLVSKDHCLIDREGNAYVLKDLGSMNGTYVNGQRVCGQQVLKHGDRLTIGSTKGQFDEGIDSPLARALSLPAPPETMPSVTDVSVPVPSYSPPAPAPGCVESSQEPLVLGTSAPATHPAEASLLRAQLMALRILSYVRTQGPCGRASVHEHLVSQDPELDRVFLDRVFDDTLRRLETLGLIERPDAQGPISLRPLLGLLENALGFSVQDLSAEIEQRALR